jgi:ABC-type Mn2+/Zn2+ transport system permease subunit/Mn-dependent DtxR family transcriptional regulator
VNPDTRVGDPRVVSGVTPETGTGRPTKACKTTMLNELTSRQSPGCIRGGFGGTPKPTRRRRVPPGASLIRCVVPLTLLFAAAFPAQAAKIGEISETSLLEQAVRFFSLQDPSVRFAVAGAVLLGLSCGLLGGFIVVRRMALVGDTLSHAVLPGVALGFLWNMSKDPLAIFVGATLAGILGTSVVSLITHTTRLKEDTALGLVLASFFAGGICLLTRIQKMGFGNQSGIDKFLFGQAAAIGPDDIRLMAVITALVVLAVLVFYKELLVSSFDPDFARACGFPTRWIHHGLMLLLAFAVVISLQAVGVVLVSAMLITPAAAAYLLTDRMSRLLQLSALFGVASGVLGAFLSFLGNNLPTGPFMVLAASLVFAGAFLFSPKQGVVVRWWRQRSRARRVQRENTLKALYHVLEDRAFLGESVSLRELAERRRETIEEARAQTAELARHRFVTLHEEGDQALLTPEGWQTAASIVRNHRLWELYLTHAASIAADHVHDDAEKIEHPHGKVIPGTEEIHRPFGGPKPDELIGYGKQP